MTVNTQQLRCELMETAYSAAFATPKCTALKLVNASIVQTSEWVERRQTASRKNNLSSEPCTYCLVSRMELALNSLWVGNWLVLTDTTDGIDA